MWRRCKRPGDIQDLGPQGLTPIAPLTYNGVGAISVASAMDQNPEIWAEILAVTSSLRELRQIKVTFCSGVLVILPGQSKEWLQRARQGTCKTLRGRPWPLGGGTEPFLSASRQCFCSRSLQLLQKASPTTRFSTPQLLLLCFLISKLCPCKH